MIGNLEIRRLRGEAERALGARFDLREFHDLVLADGAVPLWVLGESVQAWMKRKQWRGNQSTYRTIEPSNLPDYLYAFNRHRPGRW